jgi:hypothetical protein
MCAARTAAMTGLAIRPASSWVVWGEHAGELLAAGAQDGVLGAGVDRRTSAKARRALSPAAWPNASLIALGSMTTAEPWWARSELRGSACRRRLADKNRLLAIRDFRADGRRAPSRNAIIGSGVTCGDRNGDD